jgi:excisionase family DNA binding protein
MPAETLGRRLRPDDKRFDDHAHVAEKYPLLTTAEVAFRLNVSVRKVCLMAECQEVRALKLGQRWRIRPIDLERFIQKRALLSDVEGRNAR